MVEDHFIRQYLTSAERRFVTKGEQVDGEEVTRWMAAREAVRGLVWSDRAVPLYPLEVSCTGSNGALYAMVLDGERYDVTVRESAGGWEASGTRAAVGERVRAAE